MKVLFLDFDGVLNSAQEVHYRRRIQKRHTLRILMARAAYRVGKLLCDSSWSPRFLQSRWLDFYLYYLTGHCDFCPIACANVQRLLDMFPDLRIVVSSTWRSWPRSYLRRILRRNGIDASKMIDITPLTRGQEMDGTPAKGYGRGYQIQEWLNSHPEVGYFVILDDDSDMVHLSGYLVRTNFDEGFMYRHVRRAIEMLGGCSFCERAEGHESYCRTKKAEKTE